MLLPARQRSPLPVTKDRRREDTLPRPAKERCVWIDGTVRKDMILYSLPNCPNCERLKNQLIEIGYSFEEERMDDPEVLTELRLNECFAKEAPVLKIGEVYLGML